MLSHKLLIIDKLGFVPLSKIGAELLFEVISQRYERGTTLITSNLPFDEWATYGFTDEISKLNAIDPYALVRSGWRQPSQVSRPTCPRAMPLLSAARWKRPPRAAVRSLRSCL